MHWEGLPVTGDWVASAKKAESKRLQGSVVFDRWHSLSSAPEEENAVV